MLLSLVNLKDKHIAIDIYFIINIKELVINV